MKRRFGHVTTVKIGNRKIVTKGLTSGGFADYYHTAMRVRWGTFMAATLAIFATFNAFFAGLYLAFPDSVANVPPDKPWHVLFFSIETLSTVGYGDMHPQSEWGHWVASFESFAGLIFSAVLTGMLFSRFSRPTARLLFSKSAVIGQFEGQRHLMVRVANARANMISDAVAKLWLLATVITAEGGRIRRFYELKLDRVENPSFMLSWSLFHRIDADSPLYGWDQKHMEEVEAAFIVSMRGTDEIVAQQLVARHTYGWSDIAFDHQFVDLLANNAEGAVVLDYTRFHMIEPEALFPDDAGLDDMETAALEEVVPADA
jgi:inward rectifier potassium channel